MGDAGSPEVTLNLGGPKIGSWDQVTMSFAGNLERHFEKFVWSSGMRV